MLKNCVFQKQTDGTFICEACGTVRKKMVKKNCPMYIKGVPSEQAQPLDQNILSLAQRYYQERKEWVAAGKPYRNEQEIKVIYETCEQCPHFKELEEGQRGKCTLCGCFLAKGGRRINKIAWGTTRCPDNPPRWTETQNEEFNEVEIEGEKPHVDDPDLRCCK
jgi:hypothetical protein